MDWFIKAFIRASLLWFALGIVLGVIMAMVPSWIVYRPAHAHMNVVGFLTMLVFGVGYQLLPRLFGHPLWSTRLAVAHLFLANGGLALMVLGFVGVGPGGGFTAMGGLLFAAGALCWVLNLWRTFDLADARQRARKVAGTRDLPTVGE